MIRLIIIISILEKHELNFVHEFIDLYKKYAKPIPILYKFIDDKFNIINIFNIISIMNVIQFKTPTIINISSGNCGASSLINYVFDL